MVAFLKADLQVRSYSDYLRVVWEGEKEDSMELPRGLRGQTTDNASKLQATILVPLQKLKGNQPASKIPAVHFAHFEEEDAGRDKDEESNDPGGIQGVTKEFMVHFARVVKDAQVEEKHCYPCSSTENFICNCLLIKTEGKHTVKQQGGTALKKGAQTPPGNSQHTEEPPDRGSKGIKPSQQTLLESRPLLMLAWSQKHR